MVQQGLQIFQQSICLRLLDIAESYRLIFCLDYGQFFLYYIEQHHGILMYSFSSVINTKLYIGLWPQKLETRIMVFYFSAMTI